MKKKQDTIYVTCKQCRRSILVDVHKNNIICPNCGAKYDYLELVETSAPPTPVDHRKKVKSSSNSFIKFAESKAFKIIMLAGAILSLIFTIFFFAIDGSVPGFFAALMTLLFTIALVLSFVASKQLSHPRAVMSVISFVMSAIALILIIPMAISGADAIKYMPKEFEWADMYLGRMLPEPENTYGRVITNYDSSLDVYIYKVSEADFMKYRDACIGQGYTVDADTSVTGFYTAFNDSGHKLSLRYSSDNVYGIVLHAPEKYEKIDWESKNVYSYIPEIKSDTGRIETMLENSFTIIAAETDFTEYKSYCETLKQAGFDKIISEDENSCRLEDEEKNRVTVEYIGFDRMKINYQKAY